VITAGALHVDVSHLSTDPAVSAEQSLVLAATAIEKEYHVEIASVEGSSELIIDGPVTGSLMAPNLVWSVRYVMEDGVSYSAFVDPFTCEVISTSMFDDEQHSFDPAFVEHSTGASLDPAADAHASSINAFSHEVWGRWSNWPWNRHLVNLLIFRVRADTDSYTTAGGPRGVIRIRTGAHNDRDTVAHEMMHALQRREGKSPVGVYDPEGQIYMGSRALSEALADINAAVVKRWDAAASWTLYENNPAVSRSLQSPARPHYCQF
jgi:hypothetical protein